MEPPVDVRAHVDIGGRERLARDITAAEGVFQRIHRQAEIAVAHHCFLVLRRGEAEIAVGDRGFERPGREEQPAVIRAALPGRRGQPGLREGIGEIGADRWRLGDDGRAVADRRYLPHRVDREVLRRLHRRPVFQDLGAVRNRQLLQHPADDTPARPRVGEKDDLGCHGDSFPQSRRYCQGS